MNLDRAMNALLVIAALAIAGVALRREVSVPRGFQASAADSIAVQVPGWRDLVSEGIRVGSDTAPVTLALFIDVECPFCSRFHSEVMGPVRSRFADTLSVVYLHFPIPGHRFAIPGAHVLECVRGHPRFEAVLGRLYAQQDSFGLKPWTRYLEEGGIVADSKFDACLNDVGPRALIDRQAKQSLAAGVKGTPTAMVNGWRLPAPPSLDELTRAIRAAARDSVEPGPGK